MDALVVGGGWAGLSAAVYLARRGMKVTVLEAARQLGGRARVIPFGKQRVDNGQHILLGSCRQVMDMLSLVGVPKESAFLSLPFQLHSDRLDLKAPPFPSPLHLPAAILTASGISWKARLRALAFGARFPLDQEQSVSSWLASQGQGDLERILWGPLCLAALNTPPALASAKVFRYVLQSAFGKDRHGSDLLLPKQGLNALFPEPAQDFIEREGGHVFIGRRVKALDIRGGRLRGVIWGEQTLKAKHVILATSWEACLRLIAPHPPLSPLAHTLAHLSPAPITTVYLRYPWASLPHPFLGFTEAVFHWLFDRAFCGQPGLMAAVISGPGGHMAMERGKLGEEVAKTLAQRFPAWPPPTDILVIREKRATFACTVGIDAFRPTASTAVEGLWLAGDYTHTGYPSTLEGAVVSGVKCAQAILGETFDPPSLPSPP